LGKRVSLGGSCPQKVTPTSYPVKHYFGKIVEKVDFKKISEARQKKNQTQKKQQKKQKKKKLGGSRKNSRKGNGRKGITRSRAQAPGNLPSQYPRGIGKAFFRKCNVKGSPVETAKQGEGQLKRGCSGKAGRKNRRGERS
jgi:hypothetical protein